MKRLLGALAIVVIMTAAAVPPALAQDRTLGQRVDDTALLAKVKTKLGADRAKNLVHVNVDVKGGVVHLRGSVPTEGDRREAERLAANTDGVTSVVNELVV